MKLLIIYNSEEIILVTDYTEGTAIVTPYSYLVENKENAIMMLSMLGIDTSKIYNYSPEPIIED